MSSEYAAALGLFGHSDADAIGQLKQVFNAIRELMTPPDPPKRPIGFVTPEDKSKKGPTSPRPKT